MVLVNDADVPGAPGVEASIRVRTRLLALRTEKGSDALPGLLEKRLADWWFLFEPAELNELLDAVSLPALTQSPLASALFVLTGGSASDKEKDALLRARVDGMSEMSLPRAMRSPFGQRLATALLWRLQGRIRAALALARTASPSGLSPLLTDPSAGWVAFVAQQTAVTAALAGELEIARDNIEKVVVARHASHLSFQLRDAYVLAAVLDATFGEPDDARDQLALAASVPRTSSWIESQIDARAQSVRELLAAREAGATVRLGGPDTHGELWPYTALAVGDGAMLTGRFAELETYASRLSRVVQLGPAADGLPASVVPWLRAVVALIEVRLDDARDLLQSADQRDPLIQLAWAVYFLQRRDPERALVAAAQLDSRAASHARLVVAARYLRAEALLLLGREVDAVLVLESIPPTSEWVLETSALAISAVLMDALERPAFRASSAPAIAALRRARGHGVPMPQAPTLTPRQREMLQLLREGHSRAEIAAALHLSANTVKTHLRMLFERLDVTSRDQAITKAIAWGLLA